MRFAFLVSVPVLFLLGGSVGSTSLCAQALPTATKGAEISVFGGYNTSSTDYGNFAKTGFMAGANYTIFPSHWFVNPSVEFRYDFARTSALSEHAYLVGPRAEKDFMGGRMHPYIDFLWGRGTIDFHPAVLGVQTAWGPAYSYGGGVDFDISRHLSIKGDAQGQQWNSGKNPALKPDGGDFTLAPYTYSVGVTYHFQFRGLNKQQELR